MQLLRKKKGRMVNFVPTTNLQSDNNITITRDANGLMTQVVITDGVDTKTMVLGRDGNNRLITEVTTLS